MVSVILEDVPPGSTWAASNAAA